MAAQFPSTASPQRIQSSALNPLKVPLRRGRSLMDWIRLTKSGIDLRGTGPRMLHITEEELKKHNTPDDCWLAIRGFVYNVTKYIEYHPGGADELLKGAGIDATELFDQVHRWVNYDSMLKACLIGKLDVAFQFATKKSPALNRKFLKPAAPASSSLLGSPNQPFQAPKLRNSLTVAKNGKDVQNTMKVKNISISVPTSPETARAFSKPFPTFNISPVSSSSMSNIKDDPEKKINSEKKKNFVQRNLSDSDLVVPKTLIQKVNTSWHQGNDSVTLVCYTKSPGVALKDVVCDVVDDHLLAEVFVEDKCICLSVSLFSSVQKKISVTTNTKNGIVEIKLLKSVPDVNWANIGTYKDNHGTIVKKESFKLRYRACVLKKKQVVSHDTLIYHFLLPPTCHMIVPIGCHVYLQATVEGVEIVRPYTVISPSLLDTVDNKNQIDSQNFYAMIKIYDTGTLTPFINDLKEGDTIQVSTYDGKFNISNISPYQNIVMLCAGTGFTPMARLLHHCLHETEKSVNLWFFNKTSDDILWRDQLEKLSQNFPERFSLDLVLSRPDPSWSGRKGRISPLLIEELIEKNQLKIHEENLVLFVICGSVEFSDITQQYLKDLNLVSSDIFIFTR